MSDAMLWFLNRGTGMALLAVLTISVCLGVLATRGRAGSQVPAFVTRALHRNLSLFGMALLAGHIVTAVLDEFVDIRWWIAFVPYGSGYEPLWVAAGTVATDLFLAVVVTTMVRARLGLSRWHRVHQLAHLAWALGLVHGLAIGTDRREPWAVGCYLVAVALVAVAVLARVGSPQPVRQGEPA
ncbi:ferric reductase [Nocardioides antri]|uniref:Ferric reductase n=1 Tax=Nocardioides antri TaxID=2607659 RepID=A0A5B1LZV2_9ACTN|nr:ferric reductase [Nocardioides antri]KAA1426081.1 ferric reductase [Nocardioides antri]